MLGLQKRAIGLAIISVLLGGAAGYRTARQHYNDDSAAYVRRHPDLLRLQAKNEPNGSILVIGDSIVERSGILQLCGKPAFNAGVASARLDDVDELAIDLSADLVPSRVFIQIGTNDVHPGDFTEASAWAQKYEAMIRALGARPIVLVPAPAIQRGGENGHDPKQLATLNAMLPAIAKRTGAHLMAQPIFETVDGVHPSKKGAAQWVKHLSQGCEMSPLTASPT